MHLLPPGHHEIIFELYSDVSQQLHITTRREIARGQNAQMMGFELKPLIPMPQSSLSHLLRESATFSGCGWGIKEVHLQFLAQRLTKKIENTVSVSDLKRTVANPPLMP